MFKNKWNAILYGLYLGCVSYVFYLLYPFINSKLFDVIDVLKAVSYTLWFLWINLIILHVVFFQKCEDQNV